jgi:hypothetical protein
MRPIAKGAHSQLVERACGQKGCFNVREILSGAYPDDFNIKDLRRRK